MAALQTLAVPLVLSARLRLALHPHAASGYLLALDQKYKTPQGLRSAGFLLGVRVLQRAVCPSSSGDL